MIFGVILAKAKLHPPSSTNIGIKLGFHWQMTHVEYANDVVPLHNIEW